jgi:rhamnose utilization protein RhaD (predicted bifunctional aldolase and dehydrogenase)
MSVECIEDVLEQIRKITEGKPRIVIGGGGNFSVKDEEIIDIKASGKSLTEMTEANLARVSRDAIRGLLGYDYSKNPKIREKQYKRLLLASRTGGKGPRPSVETPVHELLDTYVLHTHPTALTILSCVKECPELIRRFLGPGYLLMDYLDPGILLAQETVKLLGSYRGMPHGIIQRNHGAFFTEKNLDKLLGNHNWVVDQLTRNIDRLIIEKGLDKKPFGESVYSITGRVNRRAIMKAAYERVFGESAKDAKYSTEKIEEGLEAIKMETEKGVIYFWANGLARNYAESQLAFDNATTFSWLSPDHIVSMGMFDDYVMLDDANKPTKIREDIREQVMPHEEGLYSRTITIEGLGIMTIGGHHASDDNPEVKARLAMQFAKDALLVYRGTKALGTLNKLTIANAYFIETWEVEKARRMVMQGR